MRLNARQQLFVSAYLVHKNATRAAREAGYSLKTAYSQGAENLKKPEIKRLIDEGIAAQQAAYEAQFNVEHFTKQDWLREQLKIATANIEDFVTVEEVEVSQGRDLEPKLVTTVTPLTTAARPKGSGRVIKSISKDGSIELFNKQAALDAIGKACGWIKNDFGLEIPAGAQVVLTMPANGKEAPVETPDTPAPNEPKE